jgi:hypothetical protein
MALFESTAQCISEVTIFMLLCTFGCSFYWACDIWIYEEGPDLTPVHGDLHD